VCELVRVCLMQCNMMQLQATREGIKIAADKGAEGAEAARDFVHSEL